MMRYLSEPVDRLTARIAATCGKKAGVPNCTVELGLRAADGTQAWSALQAAGQTLKIADTVLEVEAYTVAADALEVWPAPPRAGCPALLRFTAEGADPGT